MSKRISRLIALVLALCLLLTGCAIPKDLQKTMAGFGVIPRYSSIVYTRPDMDALEESLQACTELAQTTDSADTLMTEVYRFFELYNDFYTNSVLADLRYSADLSDETWKAEYDFCSGAGPAAEAAREELLCALGQSPLREALESEDYFGAGYFDDYQGEPAIDQRLLALMEEEAGLESRYYELQQQYADADRKLEDGLYQDLAQLLIDLVKVRRKMSDRLGYRDYPNMAYEMYYDRDYSANRAQSYLEKLAQVLHDPYVQLADTTVWEDSYEYCSEKEALRYLQQTAEAMGGTPEAAFRLMKTKGLYDIEYRPNKFENAFEVYIWDYNAPFLFLNPYLDQSDKLSLAHEFGHFTADYACYGTGAGTDVAEVQSQSMEYLMLCYGRDPELLRRYKLADSLCTYVEQSAFSLFEHQLYTMPLQDLTPEKVRELYTQVGTRFGFDSSDWDTRDYVDISHLYIQPMYTISYVLSNDLALQIYQQEVDQPGQGLALYETLLSMQCSGILELANQLELQDPISADRLDALADLFGSGEF